LAIVTVIQIAHLEEYKVHTVVQNTYSVYPSRKCSDDCTPNICHYVVQKILKWLLTRWKY